MTSRFYGGSKSLRKTSRHGSITWLGWRPLTQATLSHFMVVRLPPGAMPVVGIPRVICPVNIADKTSSSRSLAAVTGHCPQVPSDGARPQWRPSTTSPGACSLARPKKLIQACFQPQSAFLGGHNTTFLFTGGRNVDFSTTSTLGLLALSNATPRQSYHQRLQLQQTTSRSWRWRNGTEKRTCPS